MKVENESKEKCVQCENTEFDYHGNCKQCGKNINVN